jgi:hypothetical protein
MQYLPKLGVKYSRTYFKRLFDEKIYTGYYCYDCEKELIFTNNQQEPYRAHTVFLNSKKKNPDFKALCCNCFTNLNDPTFKKCDCLNYLQSEITNRQSSIEEFQSKKNDKQLLLNLLLELEKNNSIKPETNPYLFNDLTKFKTDLQENIKELETNSTP